ncbi:MAG TPA: HNH endonuclease [Methanosarcina sp.]|nr:HNH endonuclease [Methanosarcina sp.]
MAKKGQYKKNAKPESVAKRAYNASPEQKKRRAGRNAARRKMEKDGKVRKGDGKDIDHKNYNTKDNSSSNLRVMDKSKNRARNRGTGGRPKGS